MILKVLMIFMLLLIGCNKYVDKTKNTIKNYSINKKFIHNKVYNWRFFIKKAAIKYNVDEKLIKSIIYAESSGNPYAKSHSNAIGLMQIKPAAAGLEVYRLNGKSGQPSIEELYNPKININIGASYINLLQKKDLIGIKDKDVMRYATIVSYVNGTSSLLKIFSSDKKKAINIINNMTINVFYENIQKHPAIQASRYLDKIITIYNLI